MAENHEHSRFISTSYYYDGHRLDPSDLDLKAYVDERIAANPSPGGSSYLVADKTITNAEILDLIATYPEIIAAPGANKVIVLSQALLYWDVAAGVYGNVQGDNDIFLVYGSDWQVNCSSLVECPSGGENKVQVLTPWAASLDGGAGLEAATMEQSQCVNQPIHIAITNGGQNMTGGNVANTLKVRVWYLIVDIPMF